MLWGTSPSTLTGRCGLANIKRKEDKPVCIILFSLLFWLVLGNIILYHTTDGMSSYTLVQTALFGAVLDLAIIFVHHLLAKLLGVWGRWL